MSDTEDQVHEKADALFARAHSLGKTGDFDQANQMGWLARFFNSEWWPL